MWHIKLINEWKKSHKFLSVQLLGVAAVIEVIGFVLGDLTPRWLNVLLIVVTFIARIVDQDHKK